MSQQPRTANDLIIEAFYQIGEFAVGETIDGYATQLGLKIINEHLDLLSSTNISIPYLRTIDFTMVPGQQTYTISNVIPADITDNRVVDLVYANYVLSGQLVYPIEILDRASYYDNMRLTQLEARPSSVFLENLDLVSQITFYPLPDQAYPITLKVKQYINKLALHQSIVEVPPYYERYLRFALARELLGFYPSGNWPQSAEDDYLDMRDKIFANTADLTIQPTILLNKNFYFYWPTILTLP